MNPLSFLFTRGPLASLCLLAVLNSILVIPNAFGQSVARVPTPKYANVVYLFDESANELRPLERTKAQPKYAGGMSKLGMLGIPRMKPGSIKLEYEIDGAACGFRVAPNSSVKFVVGVPPTIDPSTTVNIVTLNPNGSKRRVAMQSDTMQFDTSILVSYEGFTYNDHFTKIVPTHQLQPGEYAVTVSGMEFFCFGVGETKK